MFKNHLKIALRQLFKQKLYSAINITGLAIGVACCLSIALFIKDELSYDKHHPNVEDLYRIALDINWNDWKSKGTAIPPILPPTLLEEIPEIINVARFNPYFSNAGSNIVRRENQKENRYEERFVYADQSIFELFNLPVIHGDKSTLLTEPNTVAITRKIARKYFGTQNCVGEKLVLNDDLEQAYVISGVIEDIIDQNHFHYDFFLSMPSLSDSRSTNWIFNNYYGYALLAPGTDPTSLEQKLHAFSLKNFGPQFKAEMNADFRELEKLGQHYKVCLQPVRDIHLKSQGYTPQLEANGDMSYVWLFGAIALFTLFIGLVNFVNLSTARSSIRANEVGVRKVLGSNKKTLISQFLVESTMMSALGFLFGAGLTAVTLPAFNAFSGKYLSIPITDPGFILTFLGSTLVIGVLAGLYPSFYLSRFQPIKVLKGKVSQGGSSLLRSTLVVVQFAISIAMIIGTIVVFNQMNYIRTKKLGFEKDQILLVLDTYTLENQVKSFKNTLKTIPEVKNVTLSSYLPLDGGNRNSIAYYPEGSDAIDEQVLLQTWNIDEDYIQTLGMEIIQGRDFNAQMPTDSQGVILNAKAVQSFGLGENPIGKKIHSPFRSIDATVIGVVEDFHFESLKGDIREVAFFLSLSNSVISIKASAREMQGLIAKVESTWKQFAPTQPFRHEFLDDRFARMYEAEERTETVFGIFAGLTIFIACLGLLALATHLTEQRTKEIGIRKVLGASAAGIVHLLSKDFLKRVLIALLIASPLAFYFMNKWLQNFSYRIDLEWWMFAVTGIIAILIAFFTVSFQSLRAALANPINALRDE